GALLAILLALLLALYLALPYVLNGERVKAALVGQLEALLRRPVSVERVIVTLHGIKLARLRVLDPGGRKSFIEADSALATVRLPALLHKRLELSHVRLASPRIYIRRDALGYWNFSDLLTSSARAGPAPGAFGVLADISVDQTDIEDGSLEVDDRLRGKRYSIDRYNLSVRKFELEAPFEFSLSLDKVNAFGRRRFSSSLALRGTMSLAGLDWPKAFIDARQAHLEVDGRSLTGSVRISSFTAPALEARVGVPALGSADWQWLFGRPMAFSLPASRWTARARWSDPGQVQVETIRVEAGSLGARASGLLDVSGPRPLLSAEADFQDFPLEAASGLRPALAAYHLTGTASGELALAGQPGRWNVSRAHLRLRGAGARSRHWSLTDGDADVTATRNFADLAVTLSSGAFEAYHNHFGDAALSLRLVRRDLRIDYLSLKWEDSRLRLRGRVVNLPAPRKIWLSGSL
ncbi:MAG: hypothetical protein KGK30_08840, partial [Elusimicrobia bacterium]|nr:hypothetical protein [Elusimicrobiota bacterium]